MGNIHHDTDRITSYKDLRVWQQSIDLVVYVYQLTHHFPKEEMYGLTSQMRRCAISIPSNIAEGSRRGSSKEFIQFVRIAFGSGAELETQLEIAQRLKLITETQHSEAHQQLEPIQKMLNRLISSLQNKP